MRREPAHAHEGSKIHTCKEGEPIPMESGTCTHKKRELAHVRSDQDGFLFPVHLGERWASQPIEQPFIEPDELAKVRNIILSLKASSLADRISKIMR